MNTTELQSVVTELVDLVRTFPERERSQKHFSEWTIREVIAHIAGWNLQRIGELEDFLSGKTVEIITDYDVFNRQVIRQKRYYTWEQLFDEFEKSSCDLHKTFAAVPDSRAQKRIWPDQESTPTSWLRVDIEHLRDEHIKDINKILDNL